jgi:hypothetical protein
MSLRLAIALSLLATQPWCWCGAAGPPHPAPRAPEPTAGGIAPDAAPDTDLQPHPQDDPPETLDPKPYEGASAPGDLQTPTED